MKNSTRSQYIGCFCIVILLFTVTACPVPDDSVPSNEIVGHIGNPQFNLQFSNGTAVDLDLYVQTPNGSVISYLNPASQGGQLDVDCLCGNCPNGPNENIYWEVGTAPSGTYKYWVQYYDSCDGSDISSNFTLRLINNGSIVQTYSGTLSPTTVKSTVYSVVY